MASALSLSTAPTGVSSLSFRAQSRQKLSCATLQRLPSRRTSVAVRAEVSSSDAEVKVPETGIRRTPELEEKFAVLDSGKWACNSCGYVYDQSKGDPNYPVAPGLEFQKLPDDWLCPTCGAAPNTFQSLGREVAGFEQNQKYGLGTNSMTASQKGLLIWGSLAVFFALFMSGYFLS